MFSCNPKFQCFCIVSKPQNFITNLQASWDKYSVLFTNILNFPAQILTQGLTHPSLAEWMKAEQRNNSGWYSIPPSLSMPKFKGAEPLKQESKWTFYVTTKWNEKACPTGRNLCLMLFTGQKTQTGWVVGPRANRVLWFCPVDIILNHP